MSETKIFDMKTPDQALGFMEGFLELYDLNIQKLLQMRRAKFEQDPDLDPYDLKIVIPNFRILGMQVTFGDVHDLEVHT